MTDPDPTSPRDTPAAWRDRIELLAQAPPLTPRRLATGAAVVLAALVVAWFALRPPAGPSTESVLPLAGSAGDAAPGSTSTTTAATVVAHAAGAVLHPGVYELRSGARVTDLLDAAGGPAPGADVDRLNLAALVTDGERVYVPRIGEAVVAAEVGASSGDVASGPLDLNTATMEQLDALPGVGPATAKAILDERTRRGRFRSVDDLLDVRGIGPAKLDALRDLVKV